MAGATVKTYEYDYDAAGNRTGEDVGASHRSGSFNNVNQLVSLQRGKKTWDFTYDANGNLLSDSKRTFEWDARDRLTAMVSGNRRSEFSYDGFDRRGRIVKKKNGVVISDVGLPRNILGRIHRKLATIDYCHRERFNRQYTPGVIDWLNRDALFYPWGNARSLFE